ncbi:MAG: polysaccharide lyase [Myxococcota bacterium]
MTRLLAALVAFSASSATAQVTWVGDVETGDTSQFGFLLNPEVDGTPLITVMGTERAQGMFSVRVELRNNAEWPNGLKRVELQHGPEDALTAEGSELFFAWSFYLPDTLSSDPNQQIGYWESRGSFQQMMAFALSGEDLSFSTRRPQNRVQWEGEGVATPREWHRIAMRILWSKSDATGEVDVWFDGTQVVNGASAQTLADDNPHFVQFGLLRGRIEFSDTPVIFIDDAVEGLSLADVRPDDLSSVMPMPEGGMPDASVDAEVPDAETDAEAPIPDATLDVETPTETGPVRTTGEDVSGGCGCEAPGTPVRLPASAFGFVGLVWSALTS